MAKFKNPLQAAAGGMYCPNCGALPFTYPPRFPDELPVSPTEITCRICEAQLVRDPAKKSALDKGGEWRLREGAAVPPDNGDWPERARNLHAAEKAAELAQSHEWVAKELEQQKCPECGANVEIDGGRRLLDPSRKRVIAVQDFWKQTEHRVSCQNCTASLRRPAARMPLEYRGQSLGHVHPWTATGTYDTATKKDDA